MRFALAKVLLGLACLLFPVGCFNQEPKDETTTHYLRLHLPDSIITSDSVRIEVIDTENDSAQEIVFDAKLADKSQLDKIKISHYDGGKLRLRVTRFQSSDWVIILIYDYRGDGKTTELSQVIIQSNSPTRDSDRPTLTLRGRNVIESYIGIPYEDSGAACRDPRGNVFEATLSGYVDTRQLGTYTLTLSCRTLDGFVSLPVKRVIHIVPLPTTPDTVAPQLFLLGKDTVRLGLGEPYVDGGAICVDDREGSLLPQSSGVVKISQAGTYAVQYTCQDKAGNAAARVQRYVVIQSPVLFADTLAPVLTLIGRDTLELLQKQAYRDSGANCLDDRDGPVPVVAAGVVDAENVGTYRLRYDCQDRAGHKAPTVMRVIYVREPVTPPDTLPPTLALNGRDTVTVGLDQAFTDPGATCTDNRDGLFAALVEDPVKTHSAGTFTVHYLCQDRAGNSANRGLRIVKVLEPVDAIPPVTYLLGRADTTILQGMDYQDPGANCEDNRDGSFAAVVLGGVNLTALGLNTLTLRCEDKAGNFSQVTRKVTVAQRPDTTAPVITLRGPDTDSIRLGNAFVDAGAACQDDRDGRFEAQRLGQVKPGVVGPNSLRYFCQDGTGNLSDTLTRSVNVVAAPDTQKTVILKVMKDAAMNLNSSLSDNGFSPVQGFLQAGSGFASVLAYDFTGINQSTIKRAFIRTPTFMFPQAYSTSELNLGVRIRALTQSWVEGTGNWYWHDGGWRNSGATLLKYYGMPDSLKARSTNPAIKTGINNVEAAYFNDANLTAVATTTLQVTYTNSEYFVVPRQEEMVPIEFDITDYMKTADLSANQGFFIQVNTPTGYQISMLSKEIGSGDYSPQLVIEY